MCILTLETIFLHHVPPLPPCCNDHKYSFNPSTNLQEEIPWGLLLHTWILYSPFHTHMHELYHILMLTHLLVSWRPTFSTYPNFAHSCHDCYGWGLMYFNYTIRYITALIYTHYTTRKIIYIIIIWLPQSTMSHPWFETLALCHLSSLWVTIMSLDFNSWLPFSVVTTRDPSPSDVVSFWPFVFWISNLANTPIDCFHEPTHIMVLWSREI